MSIGGGNPMKFNGSGKLFNYQVNYLRNEKTFKTVTKFLARISPRSKTESNHTKLNAYEMSSLK